MSEGVGRKRSALSSANETCVECRSAEVECVGGSPCPQCLSKNITCHWNEGHRMSKRRSAPESMSSISCRPDNLATTLATGPQALDMDDQLGLLPPLFNDDLNSFEFENIFSGDSDIELNNFFGDIFSLPSYPPVTIPEDLIPVVDALSDRPAPVFQRYSSDAQVLQAYYSQIHPAFPVLPPPPANLEVDDSSEIWEPSSPLVLAILTLLVLSPYSSENDASGLDDPQLRATCVRSLANRAIEAVELQTTDPVLCDSSRCSSIHPMVPFDLEVPLALCILSLYQYLHCSNLREMTSLSEMAFDLSVKLSLHQSVNDQSIFSEARKRAWWMTYVCMCYTAIANCKPPTRKIKIADVTTPYPTTNHGSDVWKQYVLAEETLVSATLFLTSLVGGFQTKTAIPKLQHGAQKLQEIIDVQLKTCESIQLGVADTEKSPESRVVSCLTTISRMRLKSAQIKAYRYPAFIPYPGILRKFESFPIVENSSPSCDNNSLARQVYNPEKVARIFPSSGEASLRICFDCARDISQSLNTIDPAISVPPFLCSAILAGYTSLMILYFENSQPDGSVSLAGGSRLELKTLCNEVISTVRDSLTKYSTGFTTVQALNDQLHRVSVACNGSQV